MQQPIEDQLEQDIPPQAPSPFITCKSCGCMMQRGGECQAKTCATNIKRGLDAVAIAARAKDGLRIASPTKIAVLISHMRCVEAGNQERTYEIAVTGGWLELTHDECFGGASVTFLSANARTVRQLQRAVAGIDAKWGEPATSSPLKTTSQATPHYRNVWDAVESGAA